jgi:hypothetical protein
MADYIAGHSWTNCGSCLEFLSLTVADGSNISYTSQRDITFLVNNVPIGYSPLFRRRCVYL